MLDGASRIGDVVAAVVADGQPAIGITDHGNMYGVAAHVHRGPRRRHHAGARHGAVLSRARRAFERAQQGDDGGEVEHEIYHLTMLAETNERLPQPHQGHEQRLPRRLLLQARAATGSSSSDHHEGIIATSGCLGGLVLAAAARRRREGRARGRGPLPGHLRPRPLLHRAAGPRHRGRACGVPPAARDRPQAAGAAARHQRQPLHAQARRRGARRPPVRADRRAEERRRTLQVRRRRLLHQVGGGDARPLPRAARGVRQHAAGSPSAPTSRSSSARRSCRRSRCPRATTRTPTCASSRSKARRSATAQAPAPHVHRPHRVRARRHQGDGFLRVLPRGVGPRALREVAGDPRRSGAGERGRLVRRVLPAHRRHRPDQVRPAVRAVPQPGPQADARHRHGLRLALPRRDDQVRRGEVRRRPRRADHHLLDDQGAGRGARRGAGARATHTSSATRSPS